MRRFRPDWGRIGVEGHVQFSLLKEQLGLLPTIRLIEKATKAGGDEQEGLKAAIARVYALVEQGEVR